MAPDIWHANKSKQHRVRSTVHTPVKERKRRKRKCAPRQHPCARSLFLHPRTQIRIRIYTVRMAAPKPTMQHNAHTALGLVLSVLIPVRVRAPAHIFIMLIPFK